MAQVTETVARGILAGHGYTDNEVRQLAHHWLATHGEAPASKIEGLTAAQESLGVEFERVLHDNLFDLYEESPQTASHGQAPAETGNSVSARADSVQEDAADPLQGAANWLAEAHGQFSPVVLSGCLMIGYNRAKRLHDAALAARKQGGL